MSTFWDTVFGTKLPTVYYCEEAQDAIIARPGYFVSNFAYIFIGVYLLAQRDKFAKILGILSIAVGFFSGMYDASFRFNAQILDLMGMFGLVIFLLMYNFYKLKLIRKLYALITGMLLLLGYLVSIIVIEGQSGRWLFGVSLVLIIITEYLLYKRQVIGYYKYFVIALVMFLIGFMIWSFDALEILCSPIKYLNGRAIFHCITAVSILYLYLHKRENIAEKEN